jgi:hypothetical protein
VLAGDRMRARLRRGATEVRLRLTGRGPLVMTVVAGAVAFLVVVWLVVASPTPLTFLLAMALLFLCGVVIARRQITDAVTNLDLPTVGAGGRLPPPPPPVPSGPAVPGDTGAHADREHD